MTNRDNIALKEKIKSSGLTFKGAFIATLGFYAAQFVFTVVSLGLIFGGIVLLHKLLD